METVSAEKEEAPAEQTGALNQNLTNTSTPTTQSEPSEAIVPGREVIPLSDIPKALKDVPRWLVWAATEQKGKISKKSYSAVSGRKVDITKAEELATFEQAWQKLQSDKHSTGLGFVLGNGWVGLSFDNCMKGRIPVKIKKLMEAIPGYYELSPSTKDVRGFLYAPEAGSLEGCSLADFPLLGIKTEVYTDSHYFEVTGAKVGDPSDEFPDISKIFLALRSKIEEVKKRKTLSKEEEKHLAKIRKSQNGEKFIALYDRGNDKSAGCKSQKEADLTLCCILVFWFGKDPDKINRLFCASNLYRSEWHNPVNDSTYGAVIIDLAIEKTPETYGEGEKEGCFQECKAIAEESFVFFAYQGFAYLSSGDGIAYRLGNTSADRKLLRCIEEAKGKPPSVETRNSIIASKTAEVLDEGPYFPVFRRVGEYEGKHYLDLCRPDGKVIELMTEGWEIIDNPPGIFWKRKQTAEEALPDPIKGGDVCLLSQVINADGETIKFFAGFLAAILRTKFPFPLLVLEGSAGSAKTTASKILKYMIDPGTALARNLPKNTQDLAISVNSSHLAVFDNVDKVKPEMSETLCQVATGSTYVTRTLYSLDEETEVEMHAPIILTGLDGVVERADLASRCALIVLEPIDNAQRREESEVWQRAKEIRPYILGGILDAFCSGLANLDKTKIPPSRMADFAKFLLSCENGFPWPTGDATRVFLKSQRELYEQAFWKDRVAMAIVQFLERCNDKIWSGTMADLLDAIKPPLATGDDYWPKTPAKLTRRVTQAAPLLEAKGVKVVRGPKSKRGPIFHISSFLVKSVDISSLSSPNAANGLTTTKNEVNLWVNLGELIPHSDPISSPTSPPSNCDFPEPKTELLEQSGELVEQKGELCSISSPKVHPKVHQKNGANTGPVQDGELSELILPKVLREEEKTIDDLINGTQDEPS